MILLPTHRMALRLAIPELELRRMVQARQVPHVRLPNGQIRFDPERIREWVEQHKQLPETEDTNHANL